MGLLVRIQVLVVVLFISIQVSESQILNVERFRMDKDTARVWLGNAGLGFTVKKQKNNVYTFNANLNLAYLSERHSYMSLNNFKFIRQDRNNLVSEGYAHFRLTLFRRHRVSYEPFLQYQYDEGRGLLRRELYGYTFRYSIRTKTKSTFSCNSGIMYENEIWQGKVLRYATDSTGQRAVTSIFRSTSNVAVKINLSKTLNLFAVVYYQARYDKFFKPRVVTDLQLQLKLNNSFSLNSQFTSTYDALPIVEGNDFVYTFNNTIVITIGK